MPRTSPATRAQFRVFYPVQTRWNDNDGYGHVNNGTYLAYMDTVLALWQNDQGMRVTEPDGMRLVAVETGCRFHSESRFPDRLEAGIRVAHVGTCSMRFEIGIFREGSETASAEGFFVEVLTDRENHPIPIPDRARRALEAIMP